MAAVGLFVFKAVALTVAAGTLRAIATPHDPEPTAIPDVHRNQEGRRLASSDLKVQYSSYGRVIPLIYGTVRLAGNVIWSRPILETQVDSTTVNLGQTYRTATVHTHHKNYTYTATLAIALCRGPITGVSRIWAESKQIDLSKLNYTLYSGDETQLPDTTIVSFEGQDKTPAYRGIAYVVIRDFPLEDYGNRIPSFTFEVTRLPRSTILATDFTPWLEDKIKGVAFGQGVGEYLYDTVVQEKATGTFSNNQFIQQGTAQKINQNNLSNKADSLVALDDMKTTLPNVEYVILPVYWVLNTKDGTIKPAVNFNEQNTHVSPDEWRVGDYTRASAVHLSNGFSTPTDLSVLRVAQELKQRGYKVMLCPKLLQYDSDKNLLLNEVETFLFSINSYNSFITHYATLQRGNTALRDYVDAFVIGSGKTMSMVASQNDATTFIPGLKSLAAGVKASLPHAKIIFSAFGKWYHSINKWYRMDELWPDPNIDIVGIEGYFPLTSTGTTYNQIRDGWQSGEGWSYEYTTDGRQIALPKTFAWKNIKHWWSSFHINPDKTRTAWQPRMKPIWITELGFGSVNGCGNDPAIFSIPYNTAYPKGSKGRTDLASQRTALEASIDYLSGQEFIEKIFVNQWDPRPYPFHPSLDRWLLPSTWDKDCSLQGKLGQMTLSGIVENLLQEVNLTKDTYDTSALGDTVRGFIISGRQSVRASLEQLASAYFFDVVESNGALQFVKRGAASSFTIDSRQCIVQDSGANHSDSFGSSFIISRMQELELPRTVDVIYINHAQNYETGTAQAQRQTVNAINSLSMNLPIVLSQQEAQHIADISLLQTWITRTQYKFTLPPRYMLLKPTDVITVQKYVQHKSEQIEGTAGVLQSHLMRIVSTKLATNGVQEIVAVAEDISSYEYHAERQFTLRSFTIPHPLPKTELILLDLPALTTDTSAAHISYAVVAATEGWRGAALYAANDGDDDWEYQGHQAQLEKQATIGTVVNFKTHGASAYTWDKHSTIDVVLIHGELSSVTESKVLAGANLCCVGDELLQFQYATFLDKHKYRLHKLLRGRKGTEGSIHTHKPNERFVLINDAILRQPVPASSWGVNRQYKAVTYGDHLTNTAAVEFTYNATALKPYAPCHIRAVRHRSGDITISWKRRTRINGDWLNHVDAPLVEESERYEVEVIREDGAAKRTITSLKSPVAVYSAAEQIEDFGALQTSISVGVFQLSALVGRGRAGNAIV
jgi:hypothetical protein